MRYIGQKILLLFSLSVLANGAMLSCNQSISTGDLSAAFSKKCLQEALEKYHIELNYKFVASQKISLPIIRTFVPSRILA